MNYCPFEVTVGHQAMVACTTCDVSFVFKSSACDDQLSPKLGIDEDHNKEVLDRFGWFLDFTVDPQPDRPDTQRKVATHDDQHPEDLVKEESSRHIRTHTHTAPWSCTLVQDCSAVTCASAFAQDFCRH